MKEAAILPHVPAELVVRSPLYERRTIYENPFDTIIPMLHQGPDIVYATNVFPGPGPGWLLRRAEDLRIVYTDMENFIKKGNSQFASMIGEDWDVIPTELDPPRHTAFRAVLNPIFAPKAMASLDDRVRRQARQYIQAFVDKKQCDFIEDFAVPFPVTIFLDLLGLPLEEVAQFLTWERDLLRTDDFATRASATRAVKDYLMAAIEQRRRSPKDDLISNALTLEVDGRKWTTEEVLGHCFNLYIGGLDTVSANMGWHIYHLATHPEDQRALRADPSMVVVAIEELLRAYASVTTFRICARDVELKGVTIKAGDYVALPTPLANRDPSAFENPQQIRFDRKPAHLTLGFGPHRCLGQHLARRELQIAMQELLAALPEFRVRAGAEIPFHLGNILHIRSLPISWN